jgi:hypothetical protein
MVVIEGAVTIQSPKFAWELDVDPRHEKSRRGAAS